MGVAAPFGGQAGFGEAGTLAAGVFGAADPEAGPTAGAFGDGVFGGAAFGAGVFGAGDAALGGATGGLAVTGGACRIWMRLWDVRGLAKKKKDVERRTQQWLWRCLLEAAGHWKREEAYCL